MSVAAVQEAPKPGERPGRAWNPPIDELLQKSCPQQDFQGPKKKSIGLAVSYYGSWQWWKYIEGCGIGRRHDALHFSYNKQDAVLHDSCVTLMCIVLR
jgi:hypothetical protein